MATVSIILPNFNHADYLERRIQSLLNQSYQDFEIIVLDDHSTDNSREILERYRGHAKFVSIIFNEVNSGNTFVQWQKGFELASGNFIWIAESDDYCEPTLLEELVKPLIDNPAISVSFCQSLYVTPEGDIPYKTHSLTISAVEQGSRFVTKQMLGSNSIPNASMALFRRSSLNQVSGEHSKYKYCGDWLFWIQLLADNKVYISGKYLNYYFRHSNNVGSKATQSGLDFLEGNRVFQYVLQNFQPNENEIDNAIQIRMNMYLAAERNFRSPQIRGEALQSMYSIDPRIKSQLRKKRMMYSLRKLLRG